MNTNKENVPWKFALLIIAITAITFYPSLKNDFVDTWDDEGYVINNSQITELSFNKTKEIFSNALLGNYNPLTIFSFALERHFFGLHPFPYHFNNLLLHLICTVLVFWFAWLLSASLIVASVVSLLFGIHPLHVESVAWVTERKDVLYGVFYLAGMIAYVFFVRSGKNKFYVYCLIFFLLSLFSKIQAVSFPLSLLCIDFFLGRTVRKKVILEKTPFFLLSVIFGLIGIYFLKEMKAFFVSSDYTFFDRIFFGTYGLSVYFIKSFFPYKLAAFYPYPQKINQWFPFIVYASAMIVPLLIYVLWKSYKSISQYSVPANNSISRYAFFGLLFFLFNIAFLLQVVEAGGAFLADRFSYISFIGLFFIFGICLKNLSDKYPQVKTIIFSVVIIYFTLLAFVSWNRCKVWKDNLAFWNDEIKKYPTVSFPYLNRAGVFIKQHQIEKAINDFSSYILLRPANPEGFYKRGITYQLLNNHAKAIEDFTEAIRLNPDYFDAYLKRAAAYTEAGFYELAMDDYRKTLETSPYSREAWNGFGNIHFRQGLYQEAMEDINQVISIDSNYEGAFRNRAILHDLLGNYEKSISDFDRHLNLFPDDNEAKIFRERVKQKTEMNK